MWLSYQVPEYLGAQGDGEGGDDSGLFLEEILQHFVDEKDAEKAVGEAS